MWSRVVTWFPVVCPGLFHTKHLGVRARYQPSRFPVDCASARLALVPALAGVLNQGPRSGSKTGKERGSGNTSKAFGSPGGASRPEPEGVQARAQLTRTECCLTPGSVPPLGREGPGHAAQEGRRGGDGHHLSRVDSRASRWLCVESGPGRGGGAEAHRGAGLSMAPMVGGTGASAVGPWRLLDRRPGHQGRRRATARPAAGSRADPARVGSLPKPPPPAPRGQGVSFLPKALLAPTAPAWAPSWAPPCHPSSPFHLESLLLDSRRPRPSAPCPGVTLLTTCRAVWLRRRPLVFHLELGL